MKWLWQIFRFRSLLLLKETCIIACIGIAEAGKAPASGDRTAKLDAIYQCRDRGGISTGDGRNERTCFVSIEGEV